MTSHFSKTLMVFIVCLTFVGQAMASTAMSYQMISMKFMSQTSESQTMPMMDHSHHQMINENSDDANSTSEDCCEKSCSCFAGGCSSLAALIKYSNYTAVIDSSSKVTTYLPSIQNHQPSSLYRPPILS